MTMHKSAFDGDWKPEDILDHVAASLPPGHGEDADGERREFLDGHDWELVRDFDPRAVWEPRKARRWLDAERRQSIKECGDDLWRHLLEAPTDCPVVLLFSGDDLEDVIDGNHRLAAHAIKGWSIPAVIGRARVLSIDPTP